MEKNKSSQKSSKTTSRVAQTVLALTEDTINALGCSVWDVEFVKEGTDYNLIITIDKPDGIGIEDCEAVTKAINPILDEADPISTSYYLEVSSAGIERELRTDKQLGAYIGKQVQTGLFKPFSAEDAGEAGFLVGKKQLCGELVSFDAEKMIFLVKPEGSGMAKDESVSVALARKSCAYVRSRQEDAL